MGLHLTCKMKEKKNMIEKEGIMEPKGSYLGASLPVPNVQELVKKPLTRVPPRYIRPDQDSPIISSLPSSRPQVPVIDMERLSSQDLAEVEKLHVACRDWGFFQLINHEVSFSLLEKLKKETQEFFNLPLEEKQKYGQTAEDLEGFGQAFVVSEEQKLDWSDMFSIVTLPSHLRKPHLIPKLSHPFREAIEEYSKEVEKVALKTLMFMAKALKMADEEMKVLFPDGLQAIRMNYYPPCPQPEQVIGFTPHADGSAVTFLLQVDQVEGLQIKKDGVWIPVIPHPNAFIVNIGDVIQIVSNGEYKSIEHRAVVNAEKERISIATFINPNLGVEIGPALSLITPETPARFTRICFGDFLKKYLSRELKSKSNIDQYYI
ncbi:putative codeine 3-O-demethylase [Helianthus annuus]|nr:putative codeine 3-O-demethylase [Helianthus annuus]